MIADSGRSTAELIGTRDGPRVYLVHNAALEDLLLDRNLTGVEFRRACFSCSRHFLAHLADELPPADTAELMILSKGLIYQLGAAMAAETGRNLPTNLVATSRAEVSRGDVRIDVPYVCFEAPAGTLLIGDTVASGATIVAALSRYLETHSVRHVYVVSIIKSFCSSELSLAVVRRLEEAVLLRGLTLADLAHSTPAAGPATTSAGRHRAYDPPTLSLTAEHLKELDKESTFEAFMRKHGGADVGLKLTQIVLTGNRKEPVRILDIRAINQCGPVLTGTLFASPPAGGDDTIRLGFDLDRENPRAKLMVGDKVKSKGSYFNTKTISLRSKEQQPFQILAWTSDSYCEFRLELTVLAGREIETQLIRDGTEPFKVTALTKRARDTLSRTPFADYQKVYVGRILHGRQEVGFIEVDPSTWE